MSHRETASRRDRAWYLGLGSNVADREGHLRQALRALDEHQDISLLRTSGIYVSAPWGVTDQPEFMNLAAEVTTSLAPHDLLAAVKAVERAVGRQERYRWGPREIDIDLLCSGDLTVQTDRLTVPHPLVLERPFVTIPLAEIAPDLRIGSSASMSEVAEPDESVRLAIPAESVL